MYLSEKINITSATQAKETTKLWEKLSHTLQKSNLKQAIEKTELNQMYYENKGREKSVLTCETIICILKTKLEEIDQEE